MTAGVLQVDGLKVALDADAGLVKAIDGLRDRKSTRLNSSHG